MKEVEKKKIKLSYLLSGLMLLGFIVIISFGLLSGYKVIKDSLLKGALANNEAYAKKLARTADQFLTDSQDTLAYSADIIEQNLMDDTVLDEEARRLQEQANSFNSAVVVDTDRKVLAVSPKTVNVKDKVLDSSGAREANRAQRPNITNPYITITGKLVVFISHPLFDANHIYQGLVAGTLYLQDHNAFYDILGKHPYDDESFVYVIDKEGEIIFHRDIEHVGEKVDAEIIKQIKDKDVGAFRFTDVDKQRFVAGYSKLETADWYIILQRPHELVEAPAKWVVQRIGLTTTPVFILMILITLYATLRIVRPIHLLAEYTEESLVSKNVEKLKNVPSFYDEAQSLKRSLVRTLSSLQSQVEFFQNQAVIDPLTGLTNRRTMDEVLGNWHKNEIDYAIIMLDLDHFKRVNDTYGHAVGDQVLQYLAQKIKNHARTQDVCCRYGGEEFIILLPHTPLEEAYSVAESLREDLAKTVSPCGDIITMSAGVAEMSERAPKPANVIELADQALYRAKETGRNRTCTSRDEC